IADPGVGGGGAANPGPGRDRPRAKGVRLGALFLHPLSLPRSASTDSRDSPSATVSVHLREPPGAASSPGADFVFNRDCHQLVCECDLLVSEQRERL
ncbi:hypothetical protein U0070_013280, partial [Myodes glareolus]